MSRQPPTPPGPRLGPVRRPSSSLPSLPLARRSSTSTAAAAKPKTAASSSRTSKTTQKHVLLPSDPQTKPLPADDPLNENEEEAVHGYETDAGVRVRERKSAAERMSKSERRRAGCRRMTAYCIAESIRLKVLSSFLRREHNVAPRVYDNALYAMYHLPLLPGYGPNANIRSSAPPAAHDASAVNAADEAGYQGTYFDTAPDGFDPADGYISTSPTNDRRIATVRPQETDTEAEAEETDAAASTDALMSPPPSAELQTPPVTSPPPETPPPQQKPRAPSVPDHTNAAEALFFAYGVVVFFGLDEAQERAVLEDVAGASALRRARPESAWEIEELNYAYDRTITSPRIYNDFFTFKQPSHLLTLSIAHALAQSTLLAYYETLTRTILLSPTTRSIPTQLARTGALQISRTAAMRLTGTLFKLRRDVVLIGNVLDVPDVFWEEASLRGLYDAAREYFEIGERVRGVEERVAGARDLLDAIHDHMNNNAMERITWIIIWLIVAACLVEVGEVVARLVVHATTANSPREVMQAGASLVSTHVNVSSTGMLVQRAGSVLDLSAMSREEALSAVEKMFSGGNA